MGFSGIILIGNGSRCLEWEFNILGANVADKVDGIESTAMADNGPSHDVFLQQP